VRPKASNVPSAVWGRIRYLSILPPQPYYPNRAGKSAQGAAT
jgi:hypothetical protein